jgi:hypothetical protein
MSDTLGIHTSEHKILMHTMAGILNGPTRSLVDPCLGLINHAGHIRAMKLAPYGHITIYSGCNVSTRSTGTQINRHFICTSADLQIHAYPGIGFSTNGIALSIQEPRAWYAYAVTGHCSRTPITLCFPSTLQRGMPSAASDHATHRSTGWRLRYTLRS